MEILQRSDSAAECNYLVTVYLGYGIEVQVSTQGFLMAELTSAPEAMNKQKPSYILENNTPVLITPLTLAGRQTTVGPADTEQHECLNYNPVKCISIPFVHFAQIHKG